MTAAWELRDRDILLLEQRDRLGGRLYSEKRGQYWLNLGAHLFPGAGSHIRNMVATLGLEVIAIPGNKFAVWFAGKVYAPNGVDPLYNVLVYVPNGGPAPTYGVQPFPSGVACGACWVTTAMACTIGASATRCRRRLLRVRVPLGAGFPE